MKNTLLLLCLCLCALPSLAWAINHNAWSRPRLSLNGEWSVIVDPYETGYRHHRDWEPFDQKPTAPRRAYYRDAQPRDLSDRIEYDFDTGPTARVPGDWNHQRDEWTLYEGTLWYQRDFAYQLPAGQKLFLRFEAVNYRADIYLNGTKVGSHEGGFDPFEFEISDRLAEGLNSLVVRVDNRREPESVPGMTTDWWNYGGITRDVYLYETPGTYLADYHLQLDPSVAGDVATGFVQLAGGTDVREVTLEIPELGVHAVLPLDSSGRADLQLGLEGLRRWEPASPTLYAVRWTAGKDVLEDRIGFRTIERVGSELLLNGRPIFLRGISVHEEIPMGPRRAHSRADAEQLLGWARELHCNFVRLAHYPHNQHTVRLADELGILLWAEVPVYWGIHYEKAPTYANALAQLRGLVERDKNRAAVIIWSLANETPQNAARLDFLRALKTEVRRIDPHRLISAALERDEPPGLHEMVIDDPFAAEVDLLSCNEYLGWYTGLPDLCGEVTWQLDPDKPFFVSEFGAGALRGLRGPREQIWTEDYQVWVYEEQLAMLSRIPTLRGCSPWILADFRSPRRNLPGIQDHWNRKGLISAEGEKKEAFHVLKAFYVRMEEEWENRASKP